MINYEKETLKYGDLILQSNEYMKLKEARELYECNSDAKNKMEQFNKYQDDINETIKSGILDKEQVQKVRQNVKNMATELKKVEVISNLLESENNFNNFLNNLMEILSLKITGKISNETSKGNCGNCSHKK